MGRKGVETTIEERKMITNLHNQCKSFAEISRIVNRSRSTIQSITDRYGIRKMLQNNSRSGRPRKINQHIGRVIIKMIKRNPEISAIKITEYLKNSLNIGVSISTVRSFVRNQGFHGRVTRRKYFLSETNRKKKS
jgi:transposase